MSASPRRLRSPSKSSKPKRPDRQGGLVRRRLAPPRVSKAKGKIPRTSAAGEDAGAPGACHGPAAQYTVLYRRKPYENETAHRNPVADPVSALPRPGGLRRRGEAAEERDRAPQSHRRRGH